MRSFYGRYTQWMSFIDLVTASVDSNKTLSDAQKLQYMKTSVKEDKISLSFDKFDNDHNHKLQCRAEHFENKKGHFSQTHSLCFKLNAIKGEKRYIIEEVDRNNGQKSFLSSTSWRRCQFLGS